MASEDGAVGAAASTAAWVSPILATAVSSLRVVFEEATTDEAITQALVGCMLIAFAHRFRQPVL